MRMQAQRKEMSMCRELYEVLGPEYPSRFSFVLSYPFVLNEVDRVYCIGFCFCNQVKPPAEDPAFCSFHSKRHGEFKCNEPVVVKYRNILTI